MSKFFKPYEGRRPFLFISYAHKQSDMVLGTIRILHEKGWRLWYDEGIPAGSDWPANIARHMQNCERVIFFLSARALESDNCYSEMKAALRQGKPILIVRLENTIPDKKWDDILGGEKEIPLIESAEERADAILRSGFIPRRFHRSWVEKIPWRMLGLVASLLFFIASVSTLVALAAGYGTQPQGNTPDLTTPTSTPSPTPTVPPVVELGEAERYFALEFPDALQEKIIRNALENQTDEVYRWQLAEISELYFCGNLYPIDSVEGVSFDADGTCRVNGAPVIQGQVTDLNLIADMVKLEKLALICQPLNKLTDLNGHVLLRELSLAGSSVDDLSALKELPSLETLHLEHTSVHDLSPLETLPNLKSVTVSRDMLPLTWNEQAAFVVVMTRDS